MSQAVSEFVPAEIDASKWENVEPLLVALLDRPVESADEFERWIIDRSELDATLGEALALLYIGMTCDTESEKRQSEYAAYIEDVAPKIKPLAFELDKKHAVLASRFDLGERYAVINRDTTSDVELFREENIPLQTDEEKLSTEYQAAIGAMTVTFNGEEKTLPQMGVFQESTDRDERERAWRTVTDRRLQDAEKISGIFDQLVEKRDAMGRNAGFDSYVGYVFKGMRRFDYTPELCFAFHDAIEKHVMPFVERLDARRRSQLGLDSLRPWDLGVDPKGREPLRPFDGGVELVTKTQRVFDRLSPELAEMFATMGDGSNSDGARDGASLDLDSRKGKAPGGYQYMRDRSRTPFIFMNAAGQHGDISTMVHEAGHAFHSMYCVDEPLVHYRESPIEFAEVASMTMELLTMPYWGEFYPSEEDANRARRQQMEGSLGILPWIATIDAFQHALYTNPTHTREQRAETWLGLEQRFGLQGHRVDWSGIENPRPLIWQRQGHLFGNPFYYVEYGIAQLGALGIWLKSLEDGEEAALDAYRRSLSLGGSRPLPELFAAAGLPFDFGASTVARLVERVEAELEKLPD